MEKRSSDINYYNEDKCRLVGPCEPEILERSSLIVIINEPEKQLDSLDHLAQEEAVQEEHICTSQPGAFPVMGLNREHTSVYSTEQYT